MRGSSIGVSRPRHDALLQVTGRALYGDDYERPGMLYARALRSRHPHAKILRVDTSRAMKMAGVKAVITAEDVPNNRYGFTHLDQPVLADDKVCYRGDVVAVVAGESWDAATEALDLIEVDYLALPPVFDPIEAMKPDSPKVHGDSNVVSHIRIRSGDVTEGWRASSEIVEDVMRTQVVEHCHIEPHVALAEMTIDGTYVIRSAVQRPFLIASDLSRILQYAMNKIRVITPAIGGGFGGKNEITIEPYVCLLAAKTKRPVKMVLSREEEFCGTTVRHPYIVKYRSGVTKDGKIMARQVEIVSDSGAYVSWGESTLSKASIHAAGPYSIPHVRIDGYLVYTNNSIGGAMRGFGVPQVGFAYECHMDNIATVIGMDPLEFRYKNLLTDNSSLPTGQVLEVVTLKETVRKAVELLGWKTEVEWE
ncbi:MAG: molybdopterin cofactor-binding domain-containing protein [Bacillota bacterium]